jgi:4'-phosphopantetheinyl transferase
MLTDDKGIEVVVARLAVEAEAVRVSAGVLSAAERNRANRFVLSRDRRRFIACRARLRQLLGERLGVPPASVELAYGASGKPALAQRFNGSGLRFNLSHCENLAVYVFSSRTDVGIDVEAIRIVDEADLIAAESFSPREQEMYRDLPARDKPLGFLNCWTRKEAFVKAIGTGLSHPLDSFDVSLAPGEPARMLRIQNTDGDCGWRIGGFFPAPGFVAAVVNEMPS